MDNEILLKLLQKQKMTFQDIFEELKCGRNSCHKVLNNLVEKKLISKKPKNETRGQRKWYELTEKGVLHCHQLDISSINESLKRLQLISSNLRSNHSQIKEAITNQRNDIFLKNFSGKILTPEAERDFFTKMRAPDVPLLEIFRNMHEIIRQEFLVNSVFDSLKLSSMATVIKDGTLYLAKPEDLESDKLIPFPI